MQSPRTDNRTLRPMALQVALPALLALALGANAQTVYRCVKPDQSTVFQAKPCPVDQEQKQMRLQSAPTPVPGERASELSDARQIAQNRTQPPARAPLARTPTEAAPLPPCPRTYEDGASYYIGSTAPDSFDLAIARAQNRALPSRTYLKNAGKWPKHCP